ncbi:MAG: hypothetical protein V3U76_17755 [Granulosicoccus sp.]
MPVLLTTSPLKQMLLVVLLGFSLPVAADGPELKIGIDWTLPDSTTQSPNGGLILESGSSSASDPDAIGDFLEVMWSHSEPADNEFDFSDFQQRLAQTSGKVVVRLEVNSNCHAPAWANLPHLDNQSLQFWKAAYIDQLDDFVNAFADEFKANSKIIGVQLGIADGEYYQDADEDGIPESSLCPTGNNFDDLVNGSGRDGWGEFWVNENNGFDEDEASEANGLTPANFESSVKEIIDIYADAFGAYRYKLAFTNFEIFGPTPYNNRMPTIVDYAMQRGIGNRGGEIEAWMRYTNQVYGVDMKTGASNDGSCSLTFDESFADTINGRYWGDENEFYGDEDWILDSVGPLSNQAYRFYVSSMRALQLRRNYLSVYSSGQTYLRSINNQFEYQYSGSNASNSSMLTKFYSGNFIKYLSRTLGRTRSDTPDAFVMLGERTLATGYGLYPPEYLGTSEPCLIDAENDGYARVGEFGRWLSVVSSTSADTDMRKDMPAGEGNWGLNMIAERDNAHYELYARKSPSLLFDLNDQLMQERCANGCDIEVKVVFRDDHQMNLQVSHAGGNTTQLATTGDGKTRTATFPISGLFSNNFGNADFSVQTADGTELSVLMARVNIQGSASTPPAAELVSPVGSINDDTPSYTWNKVPGATWYKLWVNDSTGNVINRWYTAASAGCAAGSASSTTCTLTPTTDIASGSARWWVRTWNSSGPGPWSSSRAFSVGGALPAAASLNSPAGQINDSTPTYSWNAVADATWYRLWVRDSTGVIINKWYRAQQTGCATGTGECTITPANSVAGAAHWWIRTWNGSGSGPWSSAKGFRF